MENIASATMAPSDRYSNSHPTRNQLKAYKSQNSNYNAHAWLSHRYCDTQCVKLAEFLRFLQIKKGDALLWTRDDGERWGAQTKMAEATGCSGPALDRWPTAFVFMIMGCAAYNRECVWGWPQSGNPTRCRSNYAVGTSSFIRPKNYQQQECSQIQKNWLT